MRVRVEICNNRSIKFEQFWRAAAETGHGNMRSVLHGLQDFSIDANGALVPDGSGIVTAEVFDRAVAEGELIQVVVARRRILLRFRQKVNALAVFRPLTLRDGWRNLLESFRVI